jgi:hypothetical protein
LAFGEGGAAVAKVPAIYWRSGDDLMDDGGGRRVWWELQDSWVFHVEIAPWPPRAGTARLTFRYGPDEAHMRYAIRTEPPIHEQREEPEPGWSEFPRVVRIDHTPWQWRRFASEGFQSDGPPFWANIELPAGRVWVAFAVEQQDHHGRWFGNPVLGDWVLEVAEAQGAEPGAAPDPAGM